MELTPQLIDYAVENFPKQNIAESETVIAQHNLYNDFAAIYPNYPKLIFYIVCDKIYGFATLKDAKGDLGRKLKVTPPNNIQSLK